MPDLFERVPDPRKRELLHRLMSGLPQSRHYDPGIEDEYVLLMGDYELHEVEAARNAIARMGQAEYEQLTGNKGRPTPYPHALRQWLRGAENVFAVEQRPAAGGVAKSDVVLSEFEWADLAEWPPGAEQRAQWDEVMAEIERRARPAYQAWMHGRARLVACTYDTWVISQPNKAGALHCMVNLQVVTRQALATVLGREDIGVRFVAERGAGASTSTGVGR